MEKQIKIKMVASYTGHGIKSNGNVDLTLKCSYDELVNSVQMIQLLNNDIHIAARLPEEKPLKLGTFRLKQLVIDNDGESVIKLNSQVDFVETDNLNSIVTDKKFEIRMTADVDLETDAEMEGKE